MTVATNRWAAGHAGHPASPDLQGARALLPTEPLHPARTHRADDRQAETLQAHRATMRKNHGGLHCAHQLWLTALCLQIRHRPNARAGVRDYRIACRSAAPPPWPRVLTRDQACGAGVLQEERRVEYAPRRIRMAARCCGCIVFRRYVCDRRWRTCQAAGGDRGTWHDAHPFGAAPARRRRRSSGAARCRRVPPPASPG
jgi:hypothetical protein